MGSSTFESSDTASVNIRNIFIQYCLFHGENIFTETKQYKVLSSDSVRLQPNTTPENENKPCFWQAC